VLGVPTLAGVREWLKVPASQLGDEDLQQILDAELAIVARTCRLPVEVEGEPEATYPPALARSVLRRCQRQVAARNVPLGVMGQEGAEFGPLRVPSWDAEIRRLEASYRIPVIA
jgi:hypothetical protein